MKNRIVLLIMISLISGMAIANVVYFSTSDVGQTKAITQWGAETGIGVIYMLV